MTQRKKLEKYIKDKYGVTTDSPWMKYPGNAVFRHSENKKWFAVIMPLSKTKFGFAEDTIIDVINLKVEPIMMGSLCNDAGIFPAYHMNKSYWISVFLDGSAETEKLKWLLDISFNLTV